MSIVYYSSDVNAWMRTGSNTIYGSEAQAQRAADRSNKARERYYQKLENIELDYDDVYNQFIIREDLPEGSPPYSNGTGSAAGRGFQDLFMPNGYESVRLGDAINNLNEDVLAFLRRAEVSHPDMHVRLAIRQLLNK